MTVFGFHSSHEQVHPSALLAAVRGGEEAGFDTAMSSDHFSPWSARQGQSAFAWSWLGAALQVHLSWAPDEDTAEALAHDQWRSNVFAPPVCWDLDSAELFDAVSADVAVQRVRESVHVSADLGAHTAQLAEYAALGFDEIYLHHVGQEQDAFIDAFGAKVLPALRSGS